MPKGNSRLRREVRARMAVTGEPYTLALRKHLEELAARETAALEISTEKVEPSDNLSVRFESNE